MADDITPPPPTSPAPAAPIQAPAKSYTGLAVTSWILLILTGLVAMIPLLGFASTLGVWIVGPLIIVLAIIMITRGGTAHGVILIVLAVLLFPWCLLAPTISTAILGAAVGGSPTPSPSASASASASASPSPEEESPSPSASPDE